MSIGTYIICLFLRFDIGVYERLAYPYKKVYYLKKVNAIDFKGGMIIIISNTAQKKKKCRI